MEKPCVNREENETLSISRDDLWCFDGFFIGENKLQRWTGAALYQFDEAIVRF